jgi:hypothetical protein
MNKTNPKIEITSEEIRYIRVRTAISICTKFPKIYKKLFSDKGYTMTEDETLAANVLQELCHLEPRIKRILEYYFK